MKQNKRKLLFFMLSIALLLSGCNEKDETQNNDKVNEESTQTTDKENETTPKDEPAEEKNIDSVTPDQVLEYPDSLVALVNKKRYLPSDYMPSNLTVVAPDVISYTVPGTHDRNMVRTEVSDSLLALISDSQAQGLDIWVASAYRSYNRQKEIFDQNVASVGYDETIKVVAEPGTSEHQTGLCIDFTTESVGFTLEENFEETPEGKWLKEEAHKYGFILRYPKGKENITGYSYEPWHFRYVGVDTATEIFQQQLTLEEYKNILS